MSIMLLLTLAVAGFFYYTEKIYKKPPVDEKSEKLALMNSVSVKSIPTFFKIDKMTISLIPKNEALNSRMRWLEVEMHMTLFDTADLSLAKAYLAIIQDRIIDVSSKMGPDELNSLTGKILLEDRLKKEINSALKKPVIKNIFFASFIVQ